MTTDAPPIIAAIDPDTLRSGLAILHRSPLRLELQALPFAPLIDQLRALHATCPQLLVLVEASWQSSHNWHLAPRETPAIAARKGYHVGRNHEVGHKLIEMLQHHGIAHQEVAPLRKLWHSRDGKASHAQLAHYLPLPPRTNQEMRDAALLAWHYAGLPLRYAQNPSPKPATRPKRKP